MPTNPSLTPEWQPIALPGECAPYPLQMFSSTVIDGLAVMIAGGPSKLCVFHIDSRQRIWFSIDAQVQLSGYAVNQGTLFVQDGAVLSSWSLTDAVIVDGQTQGLCLSAFNLATGNSRNSSDSGGLSADKLAAVYKLSDDLSAKQQALTEARNRMSWVRLLEEAIWMRDNSGPGPWGKAIVWPAALNNLSTFLRQWLIYKKNTPETDAVLSSDARNGLLQAENAAAELLYSPPVVRSQQISGAPGGMVFVLGSNGTIHSLNNELTHQFTAKFDSPASLMLALAEIPSAQDPNKVSARLYYITAAGAINELDASATPPAALGSWPARGVPGTSLLPLSFVDGLLWSGGNFGTGSGFSALPPDSPNPPAINIPDDNGTWSQYDVDPAEKLALVANGSSVRLTAYATDAKVRDRWGQVTLPTPGWLTFWSGTGQDAQPAEPRLIMCVEEQTATAGTNVGFSVFVANTVDADRGKYPPPPTPIGTGTLGPGSFSSKPSRLAWLRSKPVIARQTAYVVARDSTPFDGVIEFLSRDSNFNRPLDIADRKIKETLFSNPAIDPAASAPPVVSTSSDQLVAYSLTALAAEVMPAARAEIKHLVNVTQGIKIKVNVNLISPNGSSEIVQQSVRITLMITTSEPGIPGFASTDYVDVSTGPDSTCRVDFKYDGHDVFADNTQPYYFTDSSGNNPRQIPIIGWETTLCTLSVDKENEITLIFYHK